MIGKLKKAAALGLAAALVVASVPFGEAKAANPSPSKILLESTTVAWAENTQTSYKPTDTISLSPSNITITLTDGTNTTSALTSSQWNSYVTVTMDDEFDSTPGPHSVDITISGNGSMVVGTTTKSLAYTVEPYGASDFELSTGTTSIGLNETATITYSKAPYGDVSAYGYDESIVSVNATSRGISVTGKAGGSTTITILDAGDGTNYTSATRKLNVSVKAASEFKLSASEVSILTGNNHKIEYTGNKGTVKFAIASGSEFVSLDSSTGTVTGLAAGTAKITVTDPGDSNTAKSEQTFTVTVTVPDQENPFELGTKSANIAVEKTVTIGGTKQPTGTTVSYAIKSGDGVVSVSPAGVVTGLKAGTAVINVTCSGEGYKSVTEEFTVNVTKADNAAFALTSASAKVAYGTTGTIGYKNNSGKVTFKVESGDSYVSVSNGKITVKKAGGTAKITVTDPGNDSYNGTSKTFTVQTTKGTQTITLSPASGSVKAGKSLSVKISGVKTSKPTVKTSKSSVATATVNSTSKMTVKGVKAGTATITVSVQGNANYNAATAKLSVNVASASAKSQTIKVSPSSVKSLKVKKSQNVKVTGAHTALSYKASNSNVTVKKTKTGFTVTGKKAGTTTITITAKGTSEYLEATKTVKVTVKKK